jgi:ubiquitin-activating enzyme E1
MTCYRLSDLVATISRKEVPAHAKNLILEITAEDTAEEDVEVPYVMVKLGR